MRLSSRDRRDRRKHRRQLRNDLAHMRAHLISIEEFSRRMGFYTTETDPLAQMMELALGVRPLEVPFFQHEFSPKSARFPSIYWFPKNASHVIVNSAEY